LWFRFVSPLVDLYTMSVGSFIYLWTLVDFKTLCSLILVWWVVAAALTPGWDVHIVPSNFHQTWIGWFCSPGALEGWKWTLM
jgi:hypothetical protein